MYPIAFLPPSERYFKKIKEAGLKDAFYEAIKEIRQDPFKGTPKKGDLSGIYGYDVNYRGVQYEVAYRIAEKDDDIVVIIVMAGTRENFYEQLKKYLY
ncbi:MAG: type II toxin-antitoxin system RelE/ParE family toxin [Firmicutes bacterium]|nr:type II toxin-antitoxin system RelE/ParE family toxin [Bacillota bacterium]